MHWVRGPHMEGNTVRPCPGRAPAPNGGMVRCNGTLRPVAGGKGAHGSLGLCAECGHSGPLSAHTVAPLLSDPPRMDDG